MMLGLGVGIDYALFILARHRQNLASGQSVPVAIGRANATAGLSVLFAGVTVIVAILGLKVSGIPMMAMMGYGSAIMVAVTMLASITLLPAMLGVVKHKREQRPGPVRQAEAGLQPRREVRPLGPARGQPGRFRYGGAAALVLGILAIPVFSMHLGLRRRGQRRSRLDHPQCVRPDGGRLRPRHERSARGRARRPTVAARSRRTPSPGSRRHWLPSRVSPRWVSR